jgi:hypothetical protein
MFMTKLTIVLYPLLNKIVGSLQNTYQFDQKSVNAHPLGSQGQGTMYQVKFVRS